MKNQKIIPWLLGGPPWVQYRTRLDLLCEQDDSPEVISAREEMLGHPAIMKLIDDVSNWPGHTLKRHNDANHPIHKLAFLADLGIIHSDPGMESVVARVLSHQSPEGPFQIRMNIHPRYGGKGEDQLVWMLCDAQVVVYSLVKLGYGDHPEVKQAVNHLVSHIRANGWPCGVTTDLGRFKGPGRRDDPCPYANLAMLKVMALKPDWREQEASRIGAKTLLDLWDRRKEKRPYLFAMGTHFSRIKAPLIWYDILHVSEVLSHFPDLYRDPRLQEMVSLLEQKSDGYGRYTPESIWTAWKDWDFGQKKEPSYWITFLVYKIFSKFHVDNVE